MKEFKGKIKVDRHPHMDSSGRGVFRVSFENELSIKQLRDYSNLFEAAPELLEAAKMAYTAIRHETNPSNSQLDAYFKLEKAINKALG